MSDGAPTISTHVLDTGSGLPASGIRVRLERLVDDGAAVEVGETLTDADGRIRQLLAGELTEGVYRLTFWLGDEVGRLFQRLQLDVHVDDASRSWHVPVLLAPYAITSYRGS